MPQKDGTGPLGKGPKTGRQLGTCEGTNEIPRGNGIGCRQGMNRGRGRARCGRN